MLSRAKPAIGPGSTTPAKEDKKKKKLPKVEDFLNLRDYTGAITLLEVRHFITQEILLYWR
jgi:intraflagellar transport protein 56